MCKKEKKYRAVTPENKATVLVCEEAQLFDDRARLTYPMMCYSDVHFMEPVPVSPIMAVHPYDLNSLIAPITLQLFV